MEIHQVRYFLAASQTLNFTRASELCNVAQPSLTRAIKQLEAELGGDLFRRERPHAQLTDLGQRMLPLLRQCYESANSARSLASSMKKGEVSSLKLALSRTIDITLLVPYLMKIFQAFHGLELKLLRGTGKEIGEILKNGDVELAVASTLDEDWDRIDRWPLFEETYLLGVSTTHQLANLSVIDSAELRHERLLMRNYCENGQNFMKVLQNQHIDVDHSLELSSERDLTALVDAGIGVAMIPPSGSTPRTVTRIPVAGIDMRRTVYLYGVAGRERTAAASTLMKMLRAANWSRAAN